jgi:tRNA A-37 threonylcarbamoyl transferase component Bud32
MRPPSLTIELPSRCEVVVGRRGILAFRGEAAEALAAAGFGPDGGEVLETSDLHGRRSLETFSHEGERFVVRRFRHGGLLRFLTGDRFGDRERPFRELVHSDFLAARGIGTPRVVAARALRAGWWGWRLALVSRRVEGAVDLAEVLSGLAGRASSPSERRRLATALGELVGRLHAVAFLHADLHPKNVLVEETSEGPRLLILDLDRSRQGDSLDEEERRDNLRRLFRSVRRRQAGTRYPLNRGDFRRFLASYLPAAGREGASWREDWEAIRRKDERRSLWHRGGWLLEWRLGSPGRRGPGSAR